MTDKISAAAAAGDPIAERAVQEWHRIVTQRDWDALVCVLRLVFSIFEDFQYLRRFDGPEGTALEFTARVGDDTLFGIDLVRFNSSRKMVDLVVMLRPVDVVTKLGAAAARRMASA